MLLTDVDGYSKGYTAIVEGDVPGSGTIGIAQPVRMANAISGAPLY